jgi:hypothetical protein
MFSEFRMEFVKVDSEFSSAGGSEVALRVNGEVGMVAFVSEKGRNPGCSTRSIVVGKLREG